MKRDKRRLISLIAAVSIIASMSGCRNNNNRNNNNLESKSLLSGTLLESAVVANVDGDISIIRVLPQFSGISNEEHNHYFNIITGESFHNKGNYSCELRECDTINIIGNIANYLTEDELLKAANDELNKEDIVSIVHRILDESKSLTLK